MTAAHKKSADTEVQKKTGEQGDKKTGREPVVVSNIVTEATETIRVIEEVVPEAAKSKESAMSSSGTDPLTDFKERMNEEETMAPYPGAKKNYMWPILLIFAIVIALLAGIFVYKNGIFKGEKVNGEDVNVASLSPAPTITPEPAKVIDLTQYEIEILNGSGVDGEAGRQRDSLGEEGFTVSSIGNADNSDYTDTIVQAKDDVDKDFIAKLESVLGDSFTVGATESLPEDSSASVIVILGVKK